MRHHPTYTPARISEVVAAQRGFNPGAHDGLIAEYAAFGLAGHQADDDALENAESQIINWMARQHMEARG